MATPEQMATDVAASALKSGGSFFGSLLSAPFKALGGLAKGVMGSLWSGVMMTAGIVGLKIVTPDLWRAGLHVLGGDKLSNHTAAEVKAEGIPGILKTSAMEGFGLAGAWGGLNGMVDGVTGKGTDSATGWGSMIGTTVVIAAVSAVAIGAVHHSTEVKSAGPIDPNATPKPPATPAGKAAAIKAKG